MYEFLAIFSLFALLYSALAGGIERTWISGAIIFSVFGFVVGPSGLGWLSVHTNLETIKVLAELTLALVLFTDAADADLEVLRRHSKVPVRLLLVGLPLTILLGWGIAELLFEQLTLFETALLATMLAPTDAALGKAVITNKFVPNRLRQSLNVESGLNDGICVPILFVFLALAHEQTGNQSPGILAVSFLFEEIGIGLLVGTGLAVFAAWLLRFANNRNWISGVWVQIPVVALAFASFSIAQVLEGSGFIAAFVGGLVFGMMLKKEHRKPLLHAANGTGDTFALVTWVIFGALVVGPAFANLSWQVVLYALLSLTLIRMLPVYVSLTGLGFSGEAKLFTGWFGPRGLASVVFIVIVINEGLAGNELLSHVVTLTVIFSILMHGVTAIPWAKGFGRREST